jgi:predicted esterase
MQAHHLTVPRTARYYTLGDAGAHVSEVWMVCHGYGQLAQPFLASFERVASPTRLIVAPEALSRFYLDRSALPNDQPPRVGATWMTREDRDHEIADQVAYLDALHDLVRPAAPAAVRLRVLGFSQGVATVARWLALGRARADELILWAGAFPPDVELTGFARRLGPASVVLVAGARDELASWTAADSQLQRFTDAGVSARLVAFEGGHRLDDATLDQLAADGEAPARGAR